MDHIARKTGGHEKQTLPDADVEFHRAEYARLRAILEMAHANSQLPESAGGRGALDDLLVRIRRG